MTSGQMPLYASSQRVTSKRAEGSLALQPHNPNWQFVKYQTRSSQILRNNVIHVQCGFRRMLFYLRFYSDRADFPFAKADVIGITVLATWWPVATVDVLVLHASSIIWNDEYCGCYPVRISLLHGLLNYVILFV